MTIMKCKTVIGGVARGAAMVTRQPISRGPVAKSGGMAPDLRASAVVASAEAFAGVVRGGERMVTVDETGKLRKQVKIKS